MFTRINVQSRGWRVFAIVAIIFATPILLAPGSTAAWWRSAAAGFALVGLAGYAFGYRLGPILFWRAFSVLFAAIAMLRFGGLARHNLTNLPPSPASSSSVGAIVLLFAVIAALCLALFRYAEWLEKPAQRNAGKKPEPLFNLAARAEQRQAARQRLAEVRAEMDRPMSPEMETEARSLGPSRQLSLQKHRRVSNTLLFGTIAVQVVLAFSFGGRASILVPAAFLFGGAVITTYFSAETMLKIRPRLEKSWKGAALLIAVTVVAFLIGGPDTMRLWLPRTLIADGTAMMLGNLAVATAYTFGRRP